MTRHRIYLPALTLLAALLLPSGVRAAAPDVGQHLHVEISNHPVDGFPIAKAPYTFQVTLRLHDFPAKTRYLRLDDQSGVRAKRSVVMGPCADCSTSFNWTIDFSGWSTGKHELRWHLDSEDSDPSTSGTQRQFTTARVQVCIASCSPKYRADNWHGGGSWYTGPGYVVALMISPDSALKPGGSVVIRSQYGNAQACAFANPRFHDLDHGTALGCGSVGTSTKTIAIPASLSPGDRFVVVAKGAQEAGVFEARLDDGSVGPTAFYGFQSWWSKDGLTLP